MAELLTSNIREDLRIAYRNGIEQGLYAKTEQRSVAVDEPAEGEAPAAWTKLPVIARRQWHEVLDRVFGERLPPANETTAEVKTPAEILVWAFCPRCKQPAAIRLFVEPILTIDSSGSQLKLKASSKATYHVCGQQVLPSGNGHLADGQVEAFPGDTEEEAEEESEVPTKLQAITVETEGEIDIAALSEAALDRVVDEINAGALGPDVTASRP